MQVHNLHYHCQTVDEFGKILIVYNGRICPIETYAIDFTKNFYGKKSYKDFTPSPGFNGLYVLGARVDEGAYLKAKGS